MRGVELISDYYRQVIAPPVAAPHAAGRFGSGSDVIAVDWQRLGEEIHLMGRAGERGDDSGSRIIAARLLDAATHLAFLLHRVWTPYPKWRQTVLSQLDAGVTISSAITGVLSAPDWQARQHRLGHLLEILLDLQRSLGLPAPRPAVHAFFTRRQLGVNEAIAAALVEQISDPAVKALPPGVGSIDQWCDNVAVLTRPERRRAATLALLS